jgi:hypothetical protein
MLTRAAAVLPALCRHLLFLLSCSIWVQFVPYFLVGVGEVFTK